MRRDDVEAMARELVELREQLSAVTKERDDLRTLVGWVGDSDHDIDETGSRFYLWDLSGADALMLEARSIEEAVELMRQRGWL